MTIRQLKGGCPACGSQLNITRYKCFNCGTEISGRFESCRFCHLELDLQRFITVFLVNRGNIKLVERELGISYPTVRKELKRVIEALGYSMETQGLSKAEKLAVLDRLDRGEIDYESAMAILEGESEKEE
jgi:hypothetical protein